LSGSSQSDSPWRSIGLHDPPPVPVALALAPPAPTVVLAPTPAVTEAVLPPAPTLAVPPLADEPSHLHAPNPIPRRSHTWNACHPAGPAQETEAPGVHAAPEYVLPQPHAATTTSDAANPATIQRTIARAYQIPLVSDRRRTIACRPCARRTR